MGFSESLENNLKSLEAREERDPQQVAQELARREAERQERLLAAPYADQLRTGVFTQDLLGHASRLGFSKRIKVHMAWLDTTLRLEARNLRLELQPTGTGIVAHFLTDGRETSADSIDLSSDSQALAERWLSALQ